MGNEESNNGKSSSNKNITYNPPPPINNNQNVNLNKTTKKCPYCNMVYLYTTQYFINSYNAHVENCGKFRNKNNNNNSNQNINRNPQMIGSLALTNSLNEFINETKKELPRGKKDGTFEEKVDYLRYDISKKKIDFTDGAETLYISRENVLENSIVQLEILNLFKELKIIFTGEESSDAGGLIREWLTLFYLKK